MIIWQDQIRHIVEDLFSLIHLTYNYQIVLPSTLMGYVTTR